MTVNEAPIGIQTTARGFPRPIHPSAGRKAQWREAIASKRHIRRKACDGKVRHEGKHSATIHGRRTGHGHPYKCPFCRFWHIGHRFRRKAGRQRTPAPYANPGGGA